MADLKFKQNGLRILDSRNGDLLISDPKLNVQILFTAEYLKLASEDPQKMSALGRRMVEFVAKHTERRWNIIEKKFKEIGMNPRIGNIEFIRKYEDKFKIKNMDNLRKLEKEIFYHELKPLL